MSEFTYLNGIAILAFPDLTYDERRQEKLEKEWYEAAHGVANNDGGLFLYYSNLHANEAVSSLFPDEVLREKQRIRLYSEILEDRLVRLDEIDENHFFTKLPSILWARNFDWDRNTKVFAFGNGYETWVSKFLHEVGYTLDIPESNRFRVQSLSLREPHAK